ncbi:hypothetical protein F2S88_29005, partial [Pseudomonas syringae pv. actinidiae]|nr:hypothetical protein [Pseudomonas syringae pv. actinidiae]
MRTCPVCSNRFPNST